jgi:RNA polymerase sigma-70 factor, ECF subfamily
VSGGGGSFERHAADAAVVQSVLRGDVDAFQLLVRRHQDAAFRLCNALVLDTDAAADLVQDALVRAFVNLARCREPARFRLWLMRIVRNRTFDYLRERRRCDVSLSDEAVRLRVDATVRVEPPGIEHIAHRTALEGALAQLTHPLREAFVLRYVEEMSIEEVAEVLGTGVSAVKMRVQRARGRLQRLLEAEHGSPDVTGRVSGSSDE